MLFDGTLTQKGHVMPKRIRLIIIYWGTTLLLLNVFKTRLDHHLTNVRGYL